MWKGRRSEKTETLVGDTTNEIVEDVVEDELQTDMTKPTIETFEEEDNSGNSFDCAEGEKVVNHYYDAETRVKTITSLEGNMPYFIGRDNYEENSKQNQKQEQLLS